METPRSTPPLILASASPRRRELLAQFGIDFPVIPSRFDEKSVIYTAPAEYVRQLAVGKAKTVSAAHPNSWVLAADTIVVLDDRSLDKPADAAEARSMMAALGGRTHQVYTAFALRRASGGREWNETVRTDVRFRTLSAAEIDWYVATDEPYDKAGGYGIQGLAGMFVAEIQGSCSNVVGLPVAEVMAALLREGVVTFGTNGALTLSPNGGSETSP
jgi:septum formation protein